MITIVTALLPDPGTVAVLDRDETGWIILIGDQADIVDTRLAVDHILGSIELAERGQRCEIYSGSSAWRDLAFALFTSLAS